jgi:hypothetical protein
MLDTVNSILRRHTPALHPVLKRGAARTARPFLKMLRGRLVWTHFRLWTEVVREERVLDWITASLGPLEENRVQSQ